MTKLDRERLAAEAMFMLSAIHHRLFIFSFVLPEAFPIKIDNVLARGVHGRGRLSVDFHDQISPERKHKVASFDTSRRACYCT